MVSIWASCGAATAWSSGASTRWPARTPLSRSSPLAPRINLLTTSVSRPICRRPVGIAFHGAHRRLDLGTLNGEHFAVMAGAGFDAQMISDADGRLKDRT